METVNMVLSGLGGQGILFMTKILAQAAMAKGYDVMVAETHGMAQRGGSVVSHLRIGKVASTLVRAGTAHYLLALEENEVYRNIPFLARGARLYANVLTNGFPRREVKEYLGKIAVTYRFLPAGKMAMEMGSPMGINLALLGFFAAFENTPVGHQDIRATIENISPERFCAINLKVFDAGYQWGKTRVQ
jgi:indolepyruvate ferredoxin oxidoreductase beta subunit